MGKWKKFRKKSEFVKIHMCYSHLIKNFLRTIKKHYNKDDEYVINKILIILKCIMNERSYINIKFCWQYLWKLCTHKNKLFVEKEILPKLNEIIKQTLFINNIDNNEEYFDNSSLPNDDEVLCTLSDDKNIYTKSKFYLEFLTLSANERNLNDDDCNSQKNIYFNPAFVNEVLKIFIPYLPLWTPIVEYKVEPQDPQHFTNATIESFFGEMKHQFSKKAVEIGQLPIKVGRFLQHLNEIIENKSFEFLNDFPRKKFTITKKKDDIEIWKKKEKSKKPAFS